MPAPRPPGTASLSGQTIKVVGYGRASSDPATSGTRRSVLLPVNSVQSATFHFGTSSAGTCVGDSGGPSFLGTQVVGIHSRGKATCGTDDIDSRVDAFIDAFLAANDPATCAADGRCATGCPSPDPDCPCAADGTCNATCGATPDPDCACVADGACGAACGTSDPDCCRANGTCGASGAGDPECRCRANSQCGAGCGSADPDCCRAAGRCDASCTPADVDCRNCGADGACNAACGVSDADCLDDGQVCTDAAACWGGLCAADPRGFSSCTRDTTCLNETSCQGGVCRARRDPPTQVLGGCASAPVGSGLLTLLCCGAWLQRRRSPTWPTRT